MNSVERQEDGPSIPAPTTTQTEEASASLVSGVTREWLAAHLDEDEGTDFSAGDLPYRAKAEDVFSSKEEMRREQFEKWWRNVEPVGDMTFYCFTDAGPRFGEYAHPHVNQAWQVWNAALDSQLKGEGEAEKAIGLLGALQEIRNNAANAYLVQRLAFEAIKKYVGEGN